MGGVASNAVRAQGGAPPSSFNFLIMKHNLFILFLLINIFTFFSFADEAEITLPEVTTYIPASVEQKLVITKEDIEAAHYEGLPELVERCGIQMLSYGAYGLESKASVRGFTDETVRVVIDGICVNNAQYGTFDLSAINLSAVEKIEIVRGAFTEGVEDEGSVGGVIYITMKKVDLKNTLTADVSAKTFFNFERPLDSVFQKLGYEGRLGENTFLTAGGSLNYAGNRYLYKMDKNYCLCDGVFGAYDKKGIWKNEENSAVIDGHASSFLTQYFGDGNSFSVGGIFYGGHKNIPGSANSNDQGLQRDYNNNLSFSVWTPAIADFFNMKNSVVWLFNNRYYKNHLHKSMSGSENSHHVINTIKYTGTVDFLPLAGGRIRHSAGLSADVTKLDSTNDGHHFQASGVLKETTKLAVAGDWSFSFPMAGKFCINDTKTNFAFVPKAGVAWKHNIFGDTALQITADVYRMVQFPNMDDLFWDGAGYHGNPNLTPEYGWGGDLGVLIKNIRLGQGKRNSVLNFGLTVFSDYYKDKIKWEGGTAQNIASAFYLGVDFNLNADFFAGFWTVDINGEYLYNRLLDKDNKYTYGKQIMWTPDFVCNFSTALNFELAKISLSATYTGRRYTDNSNLYFLKPYLLMNLAVEMAPIKERFTPYLKVDNLLNWQYQSVEGYAMPGISLTLGGRIKFL